jgi:hypothetical protein
VGLSDLINPLVIPLETKRSKLIPFCSLDVGPRTDQSPLFASFTNIVESTPSALKALWTRNAARAAPPDESDWFVMTTFIQQFSDEIKGFGVLKNRTSKDSNRRMVVVAKKPSDYLSNLYNSLKENGSF